MKSDITERKDIELLVNSFYEKVQEDKLLGHVFNEVMKVNWETHLPRMYSFWESVLHGKATFVGNPLQKHLMVNEKTALTEAHFNQWLELWETNIDNHFEGRIANEAKARAKIMKEVIWTKVRVTKTNT